MCHSSYLIIGRPFDTSDPALLTVIMVIFDVVRKLCTQRSSISNKMHEHSWPSFKVSCSMPLKPRTLRSMACCSCCLPVASALGWLLSASH